MSWILRYANSSIGKKQAMAVTGLLLCGFLITHLIGNFLIFVGPKAFNTYSHLLITNPLIIPAEMVLLLIFGSHIGMAIKVVIENRKAREQRYFMRSPSGRGSTFASETMPYTGFIILLFLVLHILQFKFGNHYEASYDGVVMRDLHKLVMETFASPLYVIWYVFAQFALGVHLLHGFQSAFKSLGLYHPKYNPFIQSFGKVFALIITFGFSSIPIWAYFQGGF